MRSEDEIRKHLEIRKDTFRKECFTCDTEDYCKESGYIEALEYVLQENNQ